MRTRVTIFDDTFGETRPPTVVQSLDVPMVGVPDPGPDPAAGDIRIPGTNYRLRISFLDDETGDAVARPYVHVLCAHGIALAAECPDCPRQMFTLDRLTAAMAGLDRRTLRSLLSGSGPIGDDLAHTLAGDAFDKALGIIT